uniref:Putative ovule protein n=1 Tax=Solanum chacoense TaxID=4108 RepID=A0A0V0H0G9_SOLCH
MYHNPMLSNSYQVSINLFVSYNSFNYQQKQYQTFCSFLYLTYQKKKKQQQKARFPITQFRALDYI